MSLKAFHIFFIVVSTLMMAVVAWWAARAYFAFGEGQNLLLATVCVAAAIGLPVYGMWFLRKTKEVGLV